MNPLIFTLTLLVPALAGAALPVLSRSFELRAVSAHPKADGETDFKGETATMTTEERVAFLKAYADTAATWFGDPNLDTRAVSPQQIRDRIARLKPQPLPSVRRSIRLDDGWKQAGHPCAAAKLPTPWRELPGATLARGALELPPGTYQILDLHRGAGWRYEISWRARSPKPGTTAAWSSGKESVPAPHSDGWHAFRLQCDLAAGRAYLSRDDRRVAEFPANREATTFGLTTDGPIHLDDLVCIDYRPCDDVEAPYEAVVIADDNFQPHPDPDGWNRPDYRDDDWSAATLPAVRGGFRQAGEDLYLRRQIDLPPARRAWLDIETLDPSGEIYVNGTLAAKISNRRPISLEVTRLVRPGRNLIALKVDHFFQTNPMHHSPNDRAIGWFAGRATLHLLPTDVAARQLLVHTESLGPDGAARQQHRLSLDHAGERPFTGSITIAYRRWFPTDSQTVVQRRFPVELSARESREVILPLDLPAAELWTPDRPTLYAITATLTDDAGAPVDDLAVTTGVRTLAQRAGLFLLNGKPAMLNGAQIMGYRPAPSSENAAKFNRCPPADALMGEMLAIKHMDGNMLRVHAHAANDTPDGTNDPRIAEMADQIGLALIWCSPSWIREGDERNIDHDSMGAYIRQVYQHPSIVIWEMSNHPNKFKEDDGPERTHEFVRRTVRTVLAHDSSRLISPTTFWQWTHYANDLGTIDRKGRPISPVPEYTHPLVTRGAQDSITGYGKEWSKLRQWPEGLSADCLKNKIRAWFNFEHEESAAQPNWNLCAGWPWHRLRSYERDYERGSIGRVLDFDEWRASQAWQAFSAYESMRKQIFHGVAGFSWCTIEGGANSGTYEKPLLDPLGHAKLAWHIHKMVFQPVLAGSDDADVVYGPRDTIAPAIFNLGPARKVDLAVAVKSRDGRTLDTRSFPDVALPGGRSLTRLAPYRPNLPKSGPVMVEYTVTGRD